MLKIHFYYFCFLGFWELIEPKREAFGPLHLILRTRHSQGIILTPSGWNSSVCLSVNHLIDMTMESEDGLEPEGGKKDQVNLTLSVW